MTKQRKKDHLFLGGGRKRYTISLPDRMTPTLVTPRFSSFWVSSYFLLFHQVFCVINVSTVWVKKVAPLTLFVVFSLLVNLCDWKLPWLLHKHYVYTNFGPFIWIFVWYISFYGAVILTWLIDWLIDWYQKWILWHCDVVLPYRSCRRLTKISNKSDHSVVYQTRLRKVGWIH